MGGPAGRVLDSSRSGGVLEVREPSRQWRQAVGGNESRVGWGWKLGFLVFQYIFANIYLVGYDPTCQVTKAGLRIWISYFLTRQRMPVGFIPLPAPVPVDALWRVYPCPPGLIPMGTRVFCAHCHLYSISSYVSLFPSCFLCTILFHSLICVPRPIRSSILGRGSTLYYIASLVGQCNMLSQ
jgi:hypothetical protein